MGSYTHTLTGPTATYSRKVLRKSCTPKLVIADPKNTGLWSPACRVRVRVRVRIRVRVRVRVRIGDRLGDEWTRERKVITDPKTAGPEDRWALNASLWYERVKGGREFGWWA